MISGLPETVYGTESPVRQPGKLLRSMWTDLCRSRGLAWRLFIRDISALYRQSLLGYIWAFLPPIATTLTFTLLRSQSVFDVPPTNIPYPAFVFIGTLFWQTFIDTLNSPLKAVTQAKSMLTKINFPREALILAGLGECLFNFLVRVLLLVPVMLYYHISISSTILLLPIVLLGLVAMALAIGLTLVPIGALYTDISRGILLISTFWMLLTPVVYPPATAGLTGLLNSINPASLAVTTCREILIGDPLTYLPGFVVASLLALVVTGIAWVFYRLFMPILIERMGS